MKKFNFFFFLLVLLVIPPAYSWGVNYGENNIELNPGQEYVFSVRLQNIENVDKTIGYTLNDPYGLVINSSLQPPISLPANTTGYPNNELIRLSFTLYLPYNSSEPNYNVVLTFNELSPTGDGNIAMSDARAIPINVRNTFVPEPLIEEEFTEKDYIKEISILLIFFCLLLIFFIFRTFKNFKVKKKEENKKQATKRKKIKKEVLKSIIFLFLITSFVSLCFANTPSGGRDTEAVLTIEEKATKLSINMIEDVRTNQDVLFQANYTSDNLPLTGANCILKVGGVSHTLTYSTSTQKYQKNLRFTSSGTYNYEITCSKIGFEFNSETSSFVVFSGVSSPSRPPVKELTDYFYETNYFSEDLGTVEVDVYLTQELPSPGVIFSEECETIIKEGLIFYNCFQISPRYDNNFTKNVTLTLGISNEWLRDNDINISTILIFKDGEELPTFFVGDSPEFSYFQTNFQTFSFFSVYAKRNVYPIIDYWDMLGVVEDYYKEPQEADKAEDALKLYYGIFEGTGTMTIYDFRDQLLKPDHVVLIMLISFTFIFGLAKRRKKDEK